MGALTAQSLQHENRRKRTEICSTFQEAYFNRQCEFDPREVSQRLRVLGLRPLVRVLAEGARPHAFELRTKY